ncbi:hypothetical protein L1285_21095 [Pseudoalteromonas sp. DL2-H2.2]|uniref:hypothetical protein n=1 Tax=Pseudoalteromonas sp. DL2-H2.2 TaxID=2908889 RepID=UPI001F16DF23|nr:hypothetical protein [Pseudoalteromonas sp. DL2-H2.2]MCF2910807.1 hypothetical protein [Pseudoalteromonas sp. DL2-H2.2]
MIAKRYIFWLYMGYLLLAASPSKGEENTQYQIERAAYFLTSDPQKAESILTALAQSALSKDNDYIEYHYLLSLAALLQQKQGLAKRSFESMFLRVDSDAFLLKRFDILLNIGVWLRREGNYLQSEQVLLCALKEADTTTKEMKALNSLGSVSRHFSSDSSEQKYFRKALELAKQVDNKKAIAIATNNVGVMELELERVTEAKKLFKLAFSSAQVAGYESVELSAGINLLFSLVLLNDALLYQRVLPRVEQLVNKYSASPRGIFFEWVQALAWTKFNKLKLSIDKRDYLKRRFGQIEDTALQRLLVNYAAAQLNIDVTMVNYETHLNRSAITQVEPWLKIALECGY